MDGLTATSEGKKLKKMILLISEVIIRCLIELRSEIQYKETYHSYLPK